MPERPVGVAPTWATDALYTSGPYTGSPTKIEPLTGEKAQGFAPKKRPPAQKMNSVLSRVASGVAYVEDVPVKNWRSLFKDGAGVLLDTTQFRNDGRPGAFFSQVAMTWIICGRNSNDVFYIGDTDFGVTGVPTGAVATGIPYHFGVETTSGGPRLLLFNGDGTASPINYVYSDALGYGTFHAGTLAISGVSQANDVLLLADGTILVCGATSTHLVVWRSTDGGVTFSAPINVATIATDPLNTLRQDVSGRVFAFTDSSAGNGDKIYYSDDGGLTWSVRTGIGFNTILEVAYNPEEGRWYLLTPSDIQVCSNLVSGGFTPASLAGIAPKAIWSRGNAVLVAGNDFLTTEDKLFLSTDGLGSLLQAKVLPATVSTTRYVFVEDGIGGLGLFGYGSFRESLRV